MRVPSSGSCARCLAALDLASVKVRGVWYCSPGCTQGESRGERKRAVPESWLYPVLRRFFDKRRPTELLSVEETRIRRSPAGGHLVPHRRNPAWEGVR